MSLKGWYTQLRHIERPKPILVNIKYFLALSDILLGTLVWWFSPILEFSAIETFWVGSRPGVNILILGVL
jgi:hypothetical protein